MSDPTPVTCEHCLAQCRHWDLEPAPPGKYLRICKACRHRIIECSGCDAKLIAGPHVPQSGWMGQGQRERDGTVLEWTWCPECLSKKGIPR